MMTNEETSPLPNCDRTVLNHNDNISTTNFDQQTENILRNIDDDDEAADENEIDIDKDKDKDKDRKEKEKQKSFSLENNLQTSTHHRLKIEIMDNDENNGEVKPSLFTIIHMILVVIASSTINGVVFGAVNNFGIFYVYLTDLFKQNKNLLMWNDPGEEALNQNTNSTADAWIEPLIAGVGSVNIGLIFFCSIFASVLSDRYGIRQVCFIGGALSTIGMYASSISLNLIYLYITYGLVLGIGASLVYSPSLAILGHYFTRYLGVVNGLVTAGSSLFSILMPLILRKLIDGNGVQTTFKYLSGLMALLMLCALTFKENKTRSRPGVGKYGSKGSITSIFFYDALWKNRLYVCWLVSIPLGLFGYFVPFCHLVKHAENINSSFRGELLVMVIGISSMVGRLISGPVSDFLHVNRIIMQQIAFSSIGMLTMTLTCVRDINLFIVCAGLGLFDGFFISLLGPIAFDLVGPECANQAIGLLLCFCSLPLTTGPPIAAYAFSVYNNYKLAFFAAGVPPIFASILMFNIIRLQRQEQKNCSGAILCTSNNIEYGECLKNDKDYHQAINEHCEKIYLLDGNNTANNKFKQNGDVTITPKKCEKNSIESSVIA